MKPVNLKVSALCGKILRNAALYAMFVAMSMLSGCSKKDAPDVTDTTPPADVGNLVGTVGSGQVVLTWADPADGDLDHIEITFTPAVGEQPRIVGKGVKTLTITGLTDGTEYTFTVKAVDAAGNKSTGTDKSCKPHVPDLIPPADISGLVATAGNERITLTWDDPSDNDLDHIEITFTPVVEGIAQPVGIDAGVEAALIAGLSNGTAYSFTLKAVDNSGNKSEGVIAGPCTPSDIVTVSTMEQLKAAIDAGGTKIIRLQAGTYTYTVASQGPEPISLYGNTDITLLPPESGTATIRAPGYSYSIFQVGGNATLTVGKAKATGNIVVNGSGRTIDSEGNAAYLVNVNTNGKFVMNDGVSLINNIMQAVVIAYDNASFEMNGGNISGNGASNRMGGGVYLSAGTFAMNGGEISGNIAAYGGGVYAKGIFIMNDGEIRANHSQNDGGGLYIDGGGAFTMNGGTIYGSNIDMFGNQNTCVRNGASIYLAKGGTAKWGTGINIFGMSPPVGRNDRVNGSK